MTLRVLCYAINGTGLGHLSRLLAIGREARALADVLGERVDVRFVSTTEAPQVAWDFPVYKVPSHSVVRAAGLDRDDFVAGAKLLVSNLVAGLRPDILVMDTLAQGAFGELSFLRAYAPIAVYVDRHKDPRVTNAEVHRRHLALYDRILVPDHASEAARYPIPPELADRRRFVGPVCGYRAEQALSATEVRHTLGVPPGRRLIYVSAGGGGDGAAADDLGALVEALASDRRNHLLVGYGPLYRGPRMWRENVAPLGEPDSSQYFAGVDAAIAAAGYNTYQELLAARVPTVFFAQQKGMDRQDERVKAGLAAGFHEALAEGEVVSVASLDPSYVREKLEAVLEGAGREALLARLSERPRADGALMAAVEMLALYASRRRARFDRAALFEVAALRHGWRPTAEVPFEESARAWRLWQRTALTPDALEEAQERMAEVIRGRALDERSQASSLRSVRSGLAFGERLVRVRRAARLTDAQLGELLRAFCSARGVGDAELERRRRERLGDGLGALEDALDEAQLGDALALLLARVRRVEFAPALLRLASALDRPERELDVQGLLVRLRLDEGKLGLEALEQWIAECSAPNGANGGMPHANEG